MAETSARLLKKYGDSTAVDSGSISYAEAKAEFDGVIAGLLVALAQRQKPSSLSDLQERLQRGFKKRYAFCKGVESLIPPATGDKGLITIKLRGDVGQLIEAVKEIYLRAKDDNALARKTIQIQLEATSWPAFDAIELAR